MTARLRVSAMALALMLVPAVCRADAFDSLEQTLLKIIKANATPELTDFDYDGPGSLFGYLLDSGSKQRMIRGFKEGRRYAVFATGDDDIIDLDLWIGTPSEPDRPYVKDQDEDPNPFVLFTPPADGSYCVTINNVKSNGPSFACCVVLVEVEEGHNAVRALAEALDNALGLAKARAFKAKKFPSNGLVLFGGRLARLQGDEFFDLSFEEGDYMIVASGSNAVSDVDLYATRQFRQGNQAGTLVGKDDGVGSTATCEFSIPAGSLHSIQLKNYESTKTGFVFGMILQER